MERDKLKQLAEKLKNYKAEYKIRIMEVCGTHTREFFSTGVKDIFPCGLQLVDGPGCPVCVTPNTYLDRAIEIGKKHGVTVVTFGDMIHVPSSYSSLSRAASEGMKLKIIYSPSDALDIAEKNRGSEVMLLSLGFETTAPSEAITILAAKDKGIGNFSLLAGNKITVPAVRALLQADEVQIDGFILPGHVSAVIGSEAWRFICDDFSKPCVVAGFESFDLITATLMLLDMIKTGRIDIMNEYKRAVRPEGNHRAQELMYRVFKPCDAEWRGLGVIPGSGLEIREIYSAYDAALKFPVDVPAPKEHPGCRCGELLRGLIVPTECPLFGTACSPEHAVGPCMVSSEGPCSAYYKYGR